MNNLNVAKIQLNGSSYEIKYGINLNELLNKLQKAEPELNITEIIFR